VTKLIEDYALISDSRSAALVSRSGSVDWLCMPRFDSPACFSSLLGTHQNGEWLIAPAGEYRSQRQYLPGTLVLETTHFTSTGSVTVVDAMAIVDGEHRLIRIVEGRDGEVAMRMRLIIRFDYGSIVPWVSREGGATIAVGGPDALILRTPVRHHGEEFTTVAEFTIRSGDRIPFDLAWYRSSERPPARRDSDEVLKQTVGRWHEWSSSILYRGAYEGAVHGSLTVLKGLTHRGTGAIVAAPTTSVPEWIGGSRNWDYRYCWLRDATFTLLALIRSGCMEEATAWRDWLVRAVAGDPARAQIMYGIAGERRLPELELKWLDGFEGSRPVRTGNEAAGQLQLDVFGEVMDVMHHARIHGMEPEEHAWNVQQVMLEWLEGNWRRPDQGIWEIRGEPLQFTHSKVMAWVAFDRGIKAAEAAGLPGRLDVWRAYRDEIREEVLENGVNSAGIFTRSYGSADLDAANLMIPLVGFLPPDDPRVIATVEAVESRLTQDGLVQRYNTASTPDGIDGEEGSFLLCSFWLVDNLALIGRRKEAVRLFDRLLALRNDVGLLAEEYDPRAGRQLGNFPQAFSHVALVSSAITLCPDNVGPSEERGGLGDHASNHSPPKSHQ